MSASEVYAAGDGGLRIEVRDEIETEFVGAVSDHDGVCVGATEDLIAQFKFVVDFLGRLFFWRRDRCTGLWVVGRVVRR